ncbi:MAG: CPBP family intramembrane metalloprotease [Eubacterium sp.]|nr:CPBP family intramembrane metalloprotease [Eubacterium sp.]
MKRRPLKPWHGVVFFILIMTAFFLLCVPMQMYWGMAGLAGTELLLLVMALVFAKVMGFPFRTLFPVKMPSILPVIGTILIWFSSYLLDMVFILIQYRLFPMKMEELNSGISNMMTSIPFLLSVFLIAVMPAVCEEAVHRGVIIHTLYPIRRKWLVVVIMGIYFGLFHTDPLRFLPTAVMGAALSYIMLETENMVYPSLLHFVNNFFPILMQYLLLWGTSSNPMMEDAQQIGEELLDQSGLQVPIATIGIYMIFAAAAPFGLYLGNYLLHHQKGKTRNFLPQDKKWATVCKIALPSILLLGFGMMLTVLGVITELFRFR